MSHLPKGHIRYRGKVYVNAACAGRILGVSGMTIKRWFANGYIRGTRIASARAGRGRVFILKEALSRRLLDYECIVCGKTVHSQRMRDPAKNRFCSKKCCDKWWSVNHPVRSDGTRDHKKRNQDSY